jgi:hypothetical protein
MDLDLEQAIIQELNQSHRQTTKILKSQNEVH